MSTPGPRSGADGRRQRWARHNEERRDGVLTAALAALEEAGPGVEVPVQQIADRAGLSRTVLYRHFQDRADLDRAVQARIFDDIRDALLPAMSFDGTPVEIIRRIIAAYVGWAAAHPAQHRFAEQPASVGGHDAPMDRAIGQLAAQVEDLINVGVQVLGVRLDDATREGLDPLVFGLIGAAFSAVRRWLARPSLTPAAPAFVELMTEAIWLQIQGMARARGVDLDPDVPVERLIAAALDEAGTA